MNLFETRIQPVSKDNRGTSYFTSKWPYTLLNSQPRDKPRSHIVGYDYPITITWCSSFCSVTSIYLFVCVSILFRSNYIPSAYPQNPQMFVICFVLVTYWTLSHHIPVHPTISHDYISIIVSHRPILLSSIIIPCFFPQIISHHISKGNYIENPPASTSPLSLALFIAPWQVAYIVFIHSHYHPWSLIIHYPIVFPCFPFISHDQGIYYNYSLPWSAILSAIQMPSTWAVNFILYLPRFAPGTEVPPALLRGLLPWHAAGGPLQVGTGRGRRRCLHRAEAAAGGDGGDTLPLSTKQKWEEIWRNDLPDV